MLKILRRHLFNIMKVSPWFTIIGFSAFFFVLSLVFYMQGVSFTGMDLVINFLILFFYFLYEILIKIINKVSELLSFLYLQHNLGLVSYNTMMFLSSFLSVLGFVAMALDFLWLWSRQKGKYKDIYFCIGALIVLIPAFFLLVFIIKYFFIK